MRDMHDRQQLRTFPKRFDFKQPQPLLNCDFSTTMIRPFADNNEAHMKWHACGDGLG
jgi:hypothetical protein